MCARARISLGSGFQSSYHGAILARDSVPGVLALFSTYGPVPPQDLGCEAAGEIRSRWPQIGSDALLHGGRQQSTLHLLWRL